LSGHTNDRGANRDVVEEASRKRPDTAVNVFVTGGPQRPLVTRGEMCFKWRPDDVGGRQATLDMCAGVVNIGLPSWGIS